MAAASIASDPVGASVKDVQKALQFTVANKWDPKQPMEQAHATRASIKCAARELGLAAFLDVEFKRPSSNEPSQRFVLRCLVAFGLRCSVLALPGLACLLLLH